MTEATRILKHSELSRLEKMAVNRIISTSRLGWLSPLIVLTAPVVMAWRHGWDFFGTDAFMFGIIAVMWFAEHLYGLGVGRLLRRLGIALEPGSTTAP